MDKLPDDMIESLKNSIKELQKEMAEQAEREKLDPPDRKRIEYPGIRWKPFVKQVWVKGEQFPFAEIAIGWSASLSEEQEKNLAEDCPKGKQTMLISYQFIDELIQDLQKIKSNLNG